MLQLVRNGFIVEKEYRKLTLPEFQRVVGMLGDVRAQMKDLPEIIRSAPREKIAEVLDEGFYWANVYELPLAHLIALLFYALGRVKVLNDAVASENPQAALIAWSENDELEDWDGGEGGQFQKKHIVGLLVALQRNVLSIMLYHKSLAELVEEVREGSDEAFFRAVRVDRSIMACPTFADRIAKAELESDREFFLHLRSALKGPSRKHWEAYKDLRYSLYVLRELGFDQMSDSELEDLLVHKLKLYPNVPSARKNLRKQFTESKKAATPSKRNLR